METCINDFKIKNDIVLDKKMEEGFIRTTANKTFAVKFADHDSIFIVIHAKEPKQGQDAKLLANYIVAVGKEIDPNATVFAMCDTNLATLQVSTEFNNQLHEQGFSMSGNGQHITTRKKRSILHGQCYDKKKCLQLVEAPKDAIVSNLPMETIPPFPNNILLPSPEWASDHMLVGALFDYEKVFKTLV